MIHRSALKKLYADKTVEELIDIYNKSCGPNPLTREEILADCIKPYKYIDPVDIERAAAAKELLEEKTNGKYPEKSDIMVTPDEIIDYALNPTERAEDNANFKAFLKAVPLFRQTPAMVYLFISDLFANDEIIRVFLEEIKKPYDPEAIVEKYTDMADEYREKIDIESDSGLLR